MLINHCPACRVVNADGAMSCSNCRADLDAADTIRQPLEPRVKRSSGGALWLDDLVGPRVVPTRHGKPVTDRRTSAPRDLVSPATPPVLQPSTDSAAALDVVPADVVQPAELHPAPQVAPPDPTEPPVRRRATDVVSRAERRAAARRERRNGPQAARQATDGAPEVLVVGDPNVESEQLCSLLQAFGFTVHTTAHTAEAIARCASPALFAAFVFADLSDGHGGNGINLCGRLPRGSAPDSDRAVLLVLVAAPLRPMDRVRAELAGCDDVLSTPLTRGSVARFLDARGISLPSDPRKG